MICFEVAGKDKWGINRIFFFYIRYSTGCITFIWNPAGYQIHYLASYVSLHPAGYLAKYPVSGLISNSISSCCRISGRAAWHVMYIWYFRSNGSIPTLERVRREVSNHSIGSHSQTSSGQVPTSNKRVELYSWIQTESY